MQYFREQNRSILPVRKQPRLAEFTISSDINYFGLGSNP
jgi:hypothetical protein